MEISAQNAVMYECKFVYKMFVYKNTVNLKRPYYILGTYDRH